jgi:hypothetical protein
LCRLPWTGMRLILAIFFSSALFVSLCFAQNPAVTPAKPDQHVIGTIVTADPASQTITVKADKAEAQYTISLEKARTLLKVAPGAKDLKAAIRITANDLAAGDRVDVRGFKAGDSPTSIAAASVILMSARELQEARQAEMAEWRQRGIAGTVTSIDPANLKFNMNVRTPDGPQSLVVNATPGTQFTRYSPESPKAPVSSKLSDLQAGDQARVLGNKTPDGSAITAEKVYSGSFRTIPGAITSISPDGREITLTDLQSKQPVQVVLTTGSAIRKLPPQVALMLARRLNPSLRSEAAPAGASNGQAGAGSSAGGKRMPGARSGDVSQMIERLPKITLSDLKPGDAVVVSGTRGTDNSQLIATNVIAGVEPIFQSAPLRQGRSPGGDWNLDMAIPAQ